MPPHSGVPDISCPFAACSVSKSCLLAPGAPCALPSLPNSVLPLGTLHSKNNVTGQLPSPSTASEPPPVKNTRAHAVERDVAPLALRRENSPSNVKAHSAHMGSQDNSVDDMHVFSAPLPAFLAPAPKLRQGYTKPTKAPVPVPTTLAFLTHILAKQAPTGQIWRRPEQG